MHSDPKVQGATQKVSAIRYAIGLDMFCHKKNVENCSTRNKADKLLFEEMVGTVCSISQHYYSPNFYIPLKEHNGDYNIGSNFYSVGQVKLSRENTTARFEYPKRGGMPLFYIQDGELYRDKGLYVNLNSYIESDLIKAALIVWLTRDKVIKNTHQATYNRILNAITEMLSEEMIEILMPNTEDYKKALSSLVTEFVVEPNTLTTDDIQGIFGTQSSLPSTPLQTIFFGTPGGGKSHQVKKITGEDKEKDKKGVHRTTFHPDSDYASFVGCYKPISRSEREPIYSYEELLEKVKEVQGGTYPVVKFFAKYSDSIDCLSSNQQKGAIRDAIKGKKSEGDVDINTGLAMGKYMRDLLARDDSSISYEFIPQVFTEAYVEAWKKLNPDDVANSEIVYLVIEEINRGNCAQIFGDLFQLLDRNNEGYSDYRITADSDLREYLIKELGKDHKGIQEGKISLPPNLYILATMNTSDQSLFPMDSAFKRRWDWEYVPVDYSDKVPSSRFTISLGDKEYRWIEFLKIANERIRNATDSEDKQMGNFFIKNDVSEKEFKSKVMFYLWNEVCRDEYGTQNNFFRSKQNDKEFEFSFNDLYQTDGLDKLHGFMAYLGVEYTTEEQEPKYPEQEV